MQVQSISEQTAFKALNLTAEAKALIESEKGGKAAIRKYKKELANSRWDLNIKKISWRDDIYPYFGNERSAWVVPYYQQDEYVMVSSALTGGDCDDDVIDVLKFASEERAHKVCWLLKSYSLDVMNNTPLQKFKWYAEAMKAFTEAELVPQIQSPWAHFLRPISEPVTKSVTPKTNTVENIQKEQKQEKTSFTERLKAAWNVLRGK